MMDHLDLGLYLLESSGGTLMAVISRHSLNFMIHLMSEECPIHILNDVTDLYKSQAIHYMYLSTAEVAEPIQGV
jgi:hypothetical protein